MFSMSNIKKCCYHYRAIIINSFVSAIFMDVVISIAEISRHQRFAFVMHLYVGMSLSVSEEMHKFIAEQLNTSRVPLCINPQSAAFKSFAR